jgi:hypothetical protein
MGQKAYPTSLRFGKLNHFSVIQAFARRPVWFQNLQTTQLWKHLRARTPVYGNSEHVVCTPESLKFHFNVLGWNTTSQLIPKPSRKKGPVPWYRLEDRSPLFRRKRFLVRRKIAALPTLVLGSQFSGVRRLVHCSPSRLQCCLPEKKVTPLTKSGVLFPKTTVGKKRLRRKKKF